MTSSLTLDGDSLTNTNAKIPSKTIWTNYTIRKKKKPIKPNKRMHLLLGIALKEIKCHITQGGTISDISTKNKKTLKPYIPMIVSPPSLNISLMQKKHGKKGKPKKRDSGKESIALTTETFSGPRSPVVNSVTNQNGETSSSSLDMKKVC